MPFAFKNKPVEVVLSEVSKRNDSEVTQTNFVAVNRKEIRNFCNVVLTVIGKDGSNLFVENIKNSTILFKFKTESIILQNITSSTLVFLPTNTSILMHDCEETCLAGAAQQLRIHDCNLLKLFVHAETFVIIENCREVGVAPYRIKNLDEYGDRVAKYCGSKDQCAVVQDFDCVVGSSPNWKIMDQTEWQEFSECDDAEVLNLEEGGSVQT